MQSAKTHAIHIGLVILGMAIVGVPAGIYIWHQSSTPTENAPMTAITPVIATSTPAQVIVSTTTTPTAVTAKISFEGAGTVKSISVSSGAKVSDGEVVMTISRTDLASQLSAAKKTLASAQATLTKAASSTAEVSPADQNALTQAQNSLRTAVRNAYIESNDAVSDKAGQFFVGVGTPSIKLAFTIPNSQLSINLANTLPSLTNGLSAWQKQINASSFSTATNTAALASSAEGAMKSVPGFLTTMSTAISEATTLSASAKASDLSTISTAQLNMSNALSAVVSAQDGVQAAQATIISDAKNSPALQADQAVVTVAQNTLDQLEAEMTEIVKAPETGIITIEVKDGQSVSTSTVLAVIKVSK